MTVVLVITATGDFNFTVPVGVTQITAEAIGSGSGGGMIQGLSGGNSGGASAYAKRIDYAVTPGQVIPGHVPATTPGSTSDLGAIGADAWLGSSNKSDPACIVLAQGGGRGIPGGAIGGGLAVDSVGDVKFNGGGGASNPGGFSPGTGGGGAAGPNGAGATGGAGGAPGGPGTNNGGQGDNGTGGLGGTSAAKDGVAGTEIYGGTVGSGGGGAGDNYLGDDGIGGAGGVYGAGGGTGHNNTTRGGDGAQGVILISYLLPAGYIQGQII